jgi:hypothetical protein
MLKAFALLFSIYLFTRQETFDIIIQIFIFIAIVLYLRYEISNYEYKSVYYVDENGAIRDIKKIRQKKS